MRILHTSDWHVGRGIRGRSRADEHRAVLAEIADIAKDEGVEVAIVAGDLFDSAAPSAEAETIVYEALLGLAQAVEHVVVVAGNHDNPQRLEAVGPLLKMANVHSGAYPKRAGDGGVVQLELASGERADIALLPFVSQRGVVRVDELMEADAAEHTRTYQLRVEALGRVLAEEGFRDGAVHLAVAHLAVQGGGTSGSERPSQTIFDYYVPASAFPAAAQYVALGHFHNPQQVQGPVRTWYSGSPLQLDFGEEGYQKQVLVVEVAPGLPATVRGVDLRAGVPLKTVQGDEQAVVAAGQAAGEAYLRVVVEGQQRPGLADDIREQLPNVVDVRMAEAAPTTTEPAPVVDRAPHELFAEYLEERNAHDDRVIALFQELLEDVDAPATT